ncbi:MULTISPECIES: 2-oxoglutarate dehydrogenase E1 component [Bacillaceae]|uniref:2-oxoglutarate dehydrogenase E1 component n=1 Tax=Evansella alkalicola TaxID=745819 RepID=A0ABS6JND0_9BACI|nr:MULTISPECIES: 2-oxoglutarate dehydrogenase E1 component [Bacillaceae]MBU9720071.1 2-oxoglutarate dehydrogenase E1 component [Bacillus alkalicola]
MGRSGIRFDEGWSQFYGPNLGYMLEVYDDFMDNPNSVDSDIQYFFKKWGAPPVSNTETIDLHSMKKEMGTSIAQTHIQEMHTLANAMKLADSIRRNGHRIANISPVDKRSKDDLFALEKFDLTEEQLKSVPAEFLTSDAPKDVKNGVDAVNHLKKVYTDTMAFEFKQVHDMEERNWLIQMVESGDYQSILKKNDKLQLLERLSKVEGFEHFLHKTFVGQKRFSIEGLDSMVPMLDKVIRESVADGTKKVLIGMAHRGRLNVLAHVLGKPYEMIFSEFHDAPSKELVPSEGSIGINFGWTGDVKYHLGADREIKESAVEATITLANNPSHLEFVNPVVEGFARAAQDNREKPGYPEQNKNKALPILIHGDAAFPGQGVVAETLNLGKLNGYSTGGTVHIIANNMIGFTTTSSDSRSTSYASDLAKGFEIPIVHVNADDPEACLAVMNLAYQYRRKFNKDIVIDLIGYRRYGHNEMDEPMTTQPNLYKRIKEHDTVATLYGKKLVEDKLLSHEEIVTIKEDFQRKLSNQFEKVKARKKVEPQAGDLQPPNVVETNINTIDTKVNLEILKKINEELLQFPESFHVFPKLEKILKRRLRAFEKGGTIDWALAEALALATINSEGTPIRLTGQDTERGTFSQRHLVLHDYETDDIYSPIHGMPSANASFAIYNSPLSEMACVGFEYGYNVHAPETLTIWEAQYGDFANGAQVIFDQFISGGRAKWGQKSGLVLLLPHGYEGQGPEHSSGRLERFLQLAAENNWHVANLTKASQYFHILRRQAELLGKNEVRPLVIMAPKSLLRNQTVASSPEELSSGKFQPLMLQPFNTDKDNGKVTRVVLCSGKIGVELEELMKENEYQHTQDWLQVARVEELYPFPSKQVLQLKEKFPNVSEWVWIQEEPMNMGAWNYVFPYLKELGGDDVKVKYIGRPRRSSTAEGDPKAHKKEQKRILDAALSQPAEGRDNHE